QDNDPKHDEAYEALVSTPKSEHSRHKMAKPKPGPQPDRAPVGDFESPRQWEKIQQERAILRTSGRMEQNTSGYSQRLCGVDAPKNEGRYQGKGILH
uniref:Uncharacterized protein n=1 Tax=Acrobeloides nanus TaxID=290746 RepID=A0A914D250_9BILA